MRLKRLLLATFCSTAVLFLSVSAQSSIDQKLDRIDKKLDSLLAFHRDSGSENTARELAKDTLNLRWGVRGRLGTVLDKRYFVINHNNHWKIPYWVAYHLTSALLQGNLRRTENFRSDPDLPVGSRSELEDYRNSGYDRGHNAPAADFKRSEDAMSTTFLLSNMSPQTPSLNQRKWATLEKEVRQLVFSDGEAWIVTGNLFLSPDTQQIAPVVFIGPDSVAVPTHCFKVILSRRPDGSFSAYAFLMPNQRARLPRSTRDYIISIDRLEQITGYDFFSGLDDTVESRLERQVSRDWPR